MNNKINNEHFLKRPTHPV